MRVTIKNILKRCIPSFFVGFLFIILGASVALAALTISNSDITSDGALTITGTNAGVTIGNSSVTAVTVTTDGSGNGEIILPTGAIDTTEILDGTLSNDDISSSAAISFSKLSGVAASGANSNITSLTGLTTALSVAQGGTGAVTLTGILKGNGTSAVTAVTAPSGTLVGNTDAQTLTNKTITGGNNTITGVPLAYANTSTPAGDTIANTTAETAFASSYTIPANTLSVGNVIRIKLWGVYSNAVTPPTVVGKLKLGSTQIATTGTITGGAAASNAGWSAEISMVVRSVGAGGTIDTQGYLEFATAATAALAINSPNTSVISIDTTTDQALTTTIQWGTASASNTITLRQMIVEILK